MTIVYDQFETESATSYSGSTQSKMFLPRTTINDIGALRRDVIADRATRFINHDAFVDKMYLMSDFPTVTATPAQFVWFTNRGFQRNLNLVCDEEQVYDSILGHPINYSAANGISSALLNPQGFGFQDSRVHTQLGMAFLMPTSSINLFIGSAGTLVRRTDGPEEQFCDNIWNYTGPFQSRYKTVQRLKTPTVYTPFTGKSLVSWSLASGDSTRRNTQGFTSSYNAICYLCYTTRSAPTNEVPADFALILDGPLAATAGNFVATFNPLSDTRFVASLISPESLYFGYFGFGDDFANFPRGYFQLNTVVGSRNILLKYPPQIRGWKYGISNGLPQFSMATFRSGRFGQPRDMLEQRKFTKFYNNNATFQGPVSVVFKSGTLAYERAQDYVSATNPSYNLRDSGIYDYEYKSGFGFVDMDPVD